MTINLLPGTAIESNTITTSQMNSDAWAQVYAALEAANAAYTAANDAYGQANTARNTANGAYGQANTANSGVTTIINTGTGASLGLVIALS